MVSEGVSLALVDVELPPADRHPALVYLASLSPGSRRTMRAALERIAELVSGGRVSAADLAWHRLRYQHTALVRTEIAQTYAPATANKMLSALRGVLKECFRFGYTPAEDYHRARDLKSVRGSDLPKGRALSHGELKRLFEACAADAREGKKATIGARDAALLAVLYGCGLRRGEAVALDLPDYDRATKELRVRGKGGKQRLLYAEGGAAEPWTRGSRSAGGATRRGRSSTRSTSRQGAAPAALGPGRPLHPKEARRGDRG